ncbi:MAG: pantoate--beta-alanine ligase [Dermatophilaceae bacterium]
MNVVTTRAQVRAARAAYPRLGFVPTMGYLHEGHLSLVRQAKAECGAVAVSIFVNPLQFAPTEDLASYPRDLERDLALLREVGCDLVWTPGPDEVYPPGFATSVDVRGGVTDVLEGAARPGHFRGVATVVAVLLNAVGADRAYFGQKDAQQCVVVRRMVADLAMPVQVVVGATVREADGLAMSSRNTYLTPEQRAQAPALYRALCAVAQRYAAGERDADALRTAARQVLASAPLGELAYVSVADPTSLAEVVQVDPAVGAVVSTAVRFGRTRLIDNVVLPPS